jgi:hypothetical protein
VPQTTMLQLAGVAGLWSDYRINDADKTVSCHVSSYQLLAFETGHFDGGFCAVAHDWGAASALPTLLDEWHFNVNVYATQSAFSLVLAVGRFKAAAEAAVAQSERWLSVTCVNNHNEGALSASLHDIVCAAHALETCRVLEVDSTTVPGVHAIVLHTAHVSSTRCQTARHRVALAGVRQSLLVDRARAIDLVDLLPASFDRSRVLLANNSDANAAYGDWPCVVKLPDEWSLRAVPRCLDNSLLCASAQGSQGRCTAFECGSPTLIEQGFDAVSGSCYRVTDEPSRAGYCASSGLCADATSTCDDERPRGEPQRRTPANYYCAQTPECINGTVCTQTSDSLPSPTCFDIDDDVPCGDEPDTHRCTRDGCQPIDTRPSPEFCASFEGCAACSAVRGCQYCLSQGCVVDSDAYRCATQPDFCVGGVWYLPLAEHESNGDGETRLALSADDATVLLVRASTGRVDRWHRAQSLDAALAQLTFGVGNTTLAFPRTHSAVYVEALHNITQIQFVPSSSSTSSSSSSSSSLFVVAPSCAIINSVDFSTTRSSPFSNDCQLFSNQNNSDIS